MGRRWARLAAPVLGTVLAAATLLIAPGTAQAAPNCSIAHDLHQVADNDGGYWQLELDAGCVETKRSGTFGITWMVQFWAEPQGGGDPVAKFDNGPAPGFPEQRHERGIRNFVQYGAPLGYGRYCYYAQAYFRGPDAFGGGVNIKNTGTRCTDA